MYKFLLSLTLLGFFTAAYSQIDNEKFVVQVAAYDKRVPMSYFSGINGVYEAIDQYKIYHYYVGGFETAAAAQPTRDNAVSRGFKNAYIDNMEEIRKKCSLTCSYAVPTLGAAKKDIKELRNIFFDFDRSTIRPDAANDLVLVADYLKENVTYNVELQAHTDGRGSNEYNQALSLRRAEAAKAFLISRGIFSSRIKTSTFGEEKPIAKNELNGGADTEEGRRFNRRVEIAIMDEKGQQVNIVQPIIVPADLRAK